MKWKSVLLPLTYAIVLLLTTSFAEMQRDIWADESFTATYTFHATPAMVLEDVRKNEQTPPVYFLLIWAWSQGVGQSEMALRTLSLLFGVVGIAFFTHFIQRRLTFSQTAMAGLLLALSPLVARYVVEMRVYTMLLLMSIVCIVVFEWLYQQPKNRLALACYAGVASMLFMTSYFGIGLLLAHNIIWFGLLLQQRHAWKQHLISWVLVQACIALIILPWLPSLMYQFTFTAAYIHDARTLAFDRLIMAIFGLLFYTEAPWEWHRIIITAVFWVIGIYGILRTNKSIEGFIMRTFGIPTLTMLLLFVVLQLYLSRYLMIMLPGVMISIALGLDNLRQRYPRFGTVLAAVLIGSMLIYRLSDMLNSTPVEKVWPSIAAQIAHQADPSGDVVLFQPPWQQRIFEYYYEGPPLPLRGVHHFDEFYFVEGYIPSEAWTLEEALEVTSGKKRVWLIRKPWRFHKYQLDLPYKVVDQWSYSYEGIELLLYEVQM